MSPAFSLIIPCFNEAANLERLFERVQALFTQYPDTEIVLVNNGSKDNTEALLSEFKKNFTAHNLLICTIKKNRGYGFGILSGMEMATAPVLAWTHADMQTDLLDAGKAFQIYLNSPSHQYLLIKGFRVKRKLAETVLSFGMAIFASLILKKWLVEINAQPKMMSREFYEKAKNNAPHDFSLDLYFMYLAKQKGKIETLDVVFLPRTAGEAKGGSGSSFKTKWKIIKRTLAYIISLKKTIV